MEERASSPAGQGGEDSMSDNQTPRCPLCNNVLYSKKCGLVCKNHRCALYWKLGGWCLKEFGSSLWQYTDNTLDKENRLGMKHGYPRIHKEIDKRDIDAMHEVLRKNPDLVFVIPLKYYSPDSEVVQ